MLHEQYTGFCLITLLLTDVIIGNIVVLLLYNVVRPWGRIVLRVPVTTMRSHKDLVDLTISPVAPCIITFVKAY